MIKKRIKKVYSCILMLAMVLSLMGCGGTKGDYQGYVKNLITANYIGVSEGYVKSTGANEEDVDALYLQNVARLASNLSDYYSLDIWNDTELSRAMTTLARRIYSNVKFDVGKPYKDNNIDYVDVTIYPIDIINQTNEEVVAYIQGFNEAVDRGDYDDYTKEQYEYEYASGIMGILANAVNEISYAEPQVVQVRIIVSEDTFYIGNDDFRNIDKAIILSETYDIATETDATESIETNEQSESDAESE
ncbi:MAG: hypothetical protein K6E10_07215 [Eubacterium sp.]|nr:hypothetical protein [Eubacterium sp.]